MIFYGMRSAQLMLPIRNSHQIKVYFILIKFIVPLTFDEKFLNLFPIEEFPFVKPDTHYLVVLEIQTVY